MRKIILSMTMLAALSSVCSASSYDDGPTYEPKTARSSGGFLKTAIVGALMALSPTPAQAQQSTFVGAFRGSLDYYPPKNSDVINITSILTTNYNVGAYYYYNTPISLYHTGFLQMRTECEIASDCNNFYIKETRLCNKTFDVNYYASMKYTTVPGGNGYSSYTNYALSVWNSTPALNTTAFDKIFSSTIKNGTCPNSSSLFS